MSFSENAKKYRPYNPVNLTDRTWPDRVIEQPPRWCSVDLRDGNQALVNPMGSERKMRLYKRLLSSGFKEIEIGFPAASETDFDFFRHLIEQREIPEGVSIQALTQSREELITRTFEALRGARRAIVHLYNSTSQLQRRVVFRLDRDGIRDIALRGAEQVRTLARQHPDTEWTFEYSPESFTGTELDFAVEVCNDVMDIWEPSPEHRAIVNLPATVEMSTPNLYADQIEWMIRNLRRRDSLWVSLHPHNDRGTATAAAELGLLAGADRIEGTLFGNGERTGNVDIINLAINMLTQGLDPQLDFSNINEVIRDAEHCNQLPVPVRHPWAGELVFTSFSGSHQDAINKGMAALKQSNSPLWEVPYLPIDPADLGRQYEPIIRVNSQSGKGGVAFILETDYGLKLPRSLQIEFSKIIQAITEETEQEIPAVQVFQTFEQTYLKTDKPYQYVSAEGLDSDDENIRRIAFHLSRHGAPLHLNGEGNGPVSALVNALQSEVSEIFTLVDYSQHSLTSGENSVALCYVEAQLGERTLHGVGRNESTDVASFEAVLSALNRLLTESAPDSQ
ncbi:MAG: 2-isopropylmalate synthase [Gammaproteobacteria bacterium AqS3]|nr:2-isopropylmalate synthase [Gammaproteobacteria bacterium AqS3]